MAYSRQWGAVAWLLLLCVPAVVLQQVTAAEPADGASSDAAPPTKPALEVSGLQLSLLSPQGDAVISGKGKYPSPVLSSPQVSLKHSFEATFSVAAGGSAVKPQQVFLALKHTASGAAAYGVAKARKDGTYAVTLPFAAIASQVGKQAGEYEVVLMVGGPEYAAGVLWSLGPVELVLDTADSPTTAVRTARLQPVNTAKPPIYHQFRPADKRPPALVSVVSTGFAVLPVLFVLLYVTAGLGANFNAWPKSPTTAVAALIFHSLLAAMLGVYLAFWRSWTLADTLPIVFIVGAPLAFFGHRALSGLASERLASKRD